jgi:transposase
MRLPCVGVDISKEWFDVCVAGARFRARFEYSTGSLNLFLKQLKKLGITKARICMEATGLYYEKLAEFLYAHGHEVVVVNPQCIKSYARTELRRSKSDPLDAALIGMYCEEKYDRSHLWQPLPEEQKRLREILRRRQALVEERTMEKNRLQAGFTCVQVLESIRETIRFFDEQIKELECLACKLIEENPELKRLVSLAESIKGVSWLTAATVLVEVPRVLWTGRLAAVFAGLIPAKNSSGKSSGRSYLSRVGSSRLRHALYMPAVSGSQHNPVLKEFYERLLNRGLHKKQALAAVMRKLLHLIFGVIQTGQRFDPSYETKRRMKAAI